MAGGRTRLTARAAATTKPGRYGDGGGLYLVVSPSGARKWVYRFTYAGRVTEAGLGSANAVSLAEARTKAHEARRLLDTGQNPIVARRQAALINAGIPTFGAVADGLVKAKESEWRNEKHKAQWRASLTDLAAPLRTLPVGEIDTAAVLSVLKPLWQAKPETASRLRGRIEAVLDAAKAQGYRSGENPAAWRGHLAHLLPKRGKLARGHHSAMDYREVPAFIAKLREHDVIAAMALEYCILTAARSGEVYGAQWSEIDMAAKVWILPAARMKGAREHRVPLCARAVSILERLNAARTCDYVFSSPRGSKPLSHVAMAKVMRRLQIAGPTVHGFRSAFRDWAGNETHFAREVAEAALAHVIRDAAERAYRRGDALEKRRAMMEAWSQWCEPKSANVLAFAKQDGAT
jgi:integrase